MDWGEARAWVTLALAAVGAAVAVRGYLSGQRQRRLENSLRLVALVAESLRPEDMRAWEKVFHGASEPAGAPAGTFFQTEGVKSVAIPFADLFSEGPPDHGAIERMADGFELIAAEGLSGTVDLRLAYFQFGQLMDSVHGWIVTIPRPSGAMRFIDEYCPAFAHLYRSGRIRSSWAKRTYARVG